MIAFNYVQMPSKSEHFCWPDFSVAAEFFGRTGLKVLPRVGSTGHDGTEDRQSHEPEIYALSKMKINMPYRKHFTVYLSYKFVQHI